MKRFALGSLAALLSAAAAPALAAPAIQADPVAEARAALLARSPVLATLSLAHTETLTLAGGRKVVRFAQRYAGIPVVGRGAAVLLDASGAPTALATSRVERKLPASATPGVDRAAAAAVASAAARVSFDAGAARLAWLPAGDGARLVWTFYRAATGLPYAPAVAIDARTGKVVLALDAVRFDRAATVHPINPVTTPDPAPVTLDALPPGAATLTSELLRVNNCIDEQSLTLGKYPIHACVMKQLAVADAQGDFPYAFSSDTAQEDEYAEVAMFYHASKAYAYYTEIGMPELEHKPLDLVVNLRMPPGWETFDFQQMQNTQLPLEPYNNAFYTPENPFFGAFGPDGAGLWFGQGVFTDFAYDGDVVYHELGHAMVDRTIDLVYYFHLDEQGASVAPGAMNEGLADYFSSAITGDGKVGEYAAQNFFQLAAGNIRDLDNDHTCPANVSGEAHTDSTLFSGALWKVRSALPAPQQKELDAALMTALLMAPSGDVSYDELAEVMRASVEASPLGKVVADALVAELTTRGVLPKCQRILEYTGETIIGSDPKLANAFVAPGRYLIPLDESTPYAPGVLQVHLELEPDTEKVRVQIQDAPGGGNQFGEGKPYEPALLARFDSTPIEFSYGTGTASSNAGDPIEFPSFRNLELEVPEGATELYVMIVNKGDQDGRYTALTLFQQSAPKNTGGSGGTSGSGGTGGGSAGAGGSLAAEDDPELSPHGGCACRTPSAPALTAPGVWALTALGLALLRRLRSASRARAARG